MARVILMLAKIRNAISAPLYRYVRQYSALGSYSASRYSYSYSIQSSDTPVVRWINRVNIDPIRFN
jgi:hypothetical protein